MDIHGPGGKTDEETNDLKTRQRVARYVGCSEKERKAEMGHRETQTRYCQKITCYFLY